MNIKMPGVGQYDNVVEQLINAEKMPVEAARKRKDKIIEEKKEVEKLSGLLNELDSTLNGLKTKSDFYKLKAESSHPDILEATVEEFALLGTYEFEVRGVSKNEKELAYGFPDKDQTSVGFGYMLVEREDMEPAEIVIEPGSTLQDVANQINEAEAGVKAMVVNTKYTPDSYRLLVVSEKSGKEAKISIDEDTTFLEFKEQVTGRNLDVLFEDVPVQDDDNVLDEVVEGVKFHVKRAEPGTKVQVKVDYDVDATIEGIKAFVEKYNQITSFAAEQSRNPAEGEPGKLSGDGSVKQIMRQLQGALFPVANSSGKFSTLAQIGITTNPKTGELQLDESKVRTALSEDYEAVAQLFIRTKSGDGLGERMAQRLRAFRDPGAGVIRSRLRGLDRVIENQDRDIARRERQLQQKEDSIRRRFAALESQINGLQSQGSFLAQRLGGAAPQGGGKQ